MSGAPLPREQILVLLNDYLKNEIKHMRFYLYHASAVTGLHHTEYKEMFLEEAASEMKHVTAFSDVIFGLGGVPTKESNDFECFTDPYDIVKYAIKMEEEVVANYVNLMNNAGGLGMVDGRWLEIFLEGQIQK